jgi:Na+/H+ antiporter NhaD/arsenite permease-like protein
LLDSGVLAAAERSLVAYGIELRDPAVLFLIAPILSITVSNVPAVMLLLPLAVHPLAGPGLALSSTFGGNALIVGSIANIIVVQQAARGGLAISWRDHARVGLPITALSLSCTRRRRAAPLRLTCSDVSAIRAVAVAASSVRVTFGQ